MAKKKENDAQNAKINEEFIKFIVYIFVRFRLFVDSWLFFLLIIVLQLIAEQN